MGFAFLNIISRLVNVCISVDGRMGTPFSPFTICCPFSISFQGFMVLCFAFDASFPFRLEDAFVSFLHFWSFYRSSSLSIVLSVYSLSTHVY